MYEGLGLMRSVAARPVEGTPYSGDAATHFGKGETAGTSCNMAYIDVVDPAGELVHAGMGLKFPRRSAAEILLKLEKFGVGLLVKEDGSVIDDDDVVDSACVYRLIPVNRVAPNHSHSHSGEVEEVMRSVEVALKRHTQLIENLIRSGVKIALSNNSPCSSDGGRCDSRDDQRRSLEPRTGSPPKSAPEEVGSSSKP